MTDYSRSAATYADPAIEMRRRPLAPATTGPAFDGRDVAALIAAAIMTLAPLAMAAFWAPYH